MARPTKPLITKESAAVAALEIIDTEGLQSLSLNNVAKKLGVRAPSLYHHFKNKSELLAAVAKAILYQPAPLSVRKPRGDWKETIVQLCTWARRQLMSHPNAAPLLLEVYPERAMLNMYEHWFEIYEVPAKDKLLLSDGLEKLTFGSALIGATSRAQGIPPFPQDLDKERYPATYEAIRTNRKSDERLFQESIRRYLDSF